MAPELTCPLQPKLFLEILRNGQMHQACRRWTVTFKWTQSSCASISLLHCELFLPFFLVCSMTLTVHIHLCLLMEKRTAYIDAMLNYFHALAKQKQRGNILQNIKVISGHNIQSCWHGTKKQVRVIHRTCLFHEHFTVKNEKGRSFPCTCPKISGVNRQTCLGLTKQKKRRIRRSKHRLEPTKCSKHVSNWQIDFSKWLNSVAIQ